MVIAKTLLFPVLMILFFLIAGIIGYFLIYKRRINRAVTEEKIPKRKMASPAQFALMMIFIFLLGLGIYLSFLLISTGTQQSSIKTEYYDASYNFNVYDRSEMDGYLSVYSRESNPGYSKYIETMGDIEFTYFIRDDKHDTYHPSFLIFAEYIGKEKITQYGYDGNFLSDTEEVIGGFGMAGGSTESCIVAVGNTDIECYFSFEVAFYTDYEKYDEDIGKGAASHETVTFYIPNNDYKKKIDDSSEAL